MINILVPLAGSNNFFDDSNYHYPKPIIEVAGLPMIQRVINNLSTIALDKRFIFILRNSDCEDFFLDKTINHLTNDEIIIIKTQKETRGAACSCLLAVDYIDNKDQLIISNGDQIIDEDYNKILKNFHDFNADAGCIYFESIHPRWSYIDIQNNKIQESVEKIPISKNAIAGFYYFRNGNKFISSAKKMILKDLHVNGQFFIAPTFNEMILDDLNLFGYFINSTHYHSFYSPQKIEEYEKLININNENI